MSKTNTGKMHRVSCTVKKKKKRTLIVYIFSQRVMIEMSAL